MHIDAHGDLRDEYEGTPLSHASIERRVVDMGIPLLEIGIRSMSPEEADFLKTKPDVAIVWAYQMAKGHAHIPWERLGKHTYVTIDLMRLILAKCLLLALLNLEACIGIKYLISSRRYVGEPLSLAWMSLALPYGRTDTGRFYGRKARL